MSVVFVDTSAILALLVSSDESHPRARRAFEKLRAREAKLVTTSYVLAETYELIGWRLGREAVIAFRESFAPLLEVTWVDQELHERGLDLLLKGPGDLSLVDAVSFVSIRESKISEAFAFDRHFARKGLTM